MSSTGSLLYFPVLILMAVQQFPAPVAPILQIPSCMYFPVLIPIAVQRFPSGGQIPKCYVFPCPDPDGSVAIPWWQLHTVYTQVLVFLCPYPRWWCRNSLVAATTRTQVHVFLCPDPVSAVAIPQWQLHTIIVGHRYF